MEGNTWSFGLSTSSRSYQSALKSISDLCIDFEEIEVDDCDDDDLRAEYPCPFCTEDFDLVDLCSHIDDDHAFEAQPAVCPVCAMRAGTNVVGHITTYHGDIYKGLQKLKLQKDEPYSNLSFLKKELDDGYLQSLVTGLSHTASSSKIEPDPLLSFLYNVPHADKFESVQPGCSTEVTLEEKRSDETMLERDVTLPPLSDKEHTEKAKRSEFVQGLLFSTIFDEDF